MLWPLGLPSLDAAAGNRDCPPQLLSILDYFRPLDPSRSLLPAHLVEFQASCELASTHPLELC